MKFTTREDIEAPIDYVFAQATDFAGFERSALRRGADVKRLDSNPVRGKGSAWDITFAFRGKTRQMRAQIDSFDPPNSYLVNADSTGIGGSTEIQLVPLSRNRTRLSVTLELAPKSLAARLMVQSLKLARNSLTQKFKTRVAAYAEEIEERFRKQAQ